MSLPDKLKRINEISITITHGNPNEVAGLICPYCDTPNLIFSFTVKKPPSFGYGLFIVCKKCKQRAHFSLLNKPPNFRKELVLEEFQRLEDEVVRSVGGNDK